ncbi:hypothetical protein Nepgr_025428 [Nepenthes gracilis]|uniref:Uncharacterized protein n=1 Tax=Nepenthes gracilis TaxID=150966 RepID=A0AAD3T532_NEPGR|nr:hypothetical protein Nepgr_025428 [Nepenthes gracilis]
MVCTTATAAKEGSIAKARVSCSAFIYKAASCNYKVYARSHGTSPMKAYQRRNQLGISLLQRLKINGVLRVKVPKATLHSCANMECDRARPVFLEPKISHLGYRVVIEENVGGLDIAMNDALS